MKQLIHLIQLLFSSNIIDAESHYAQNHIVDFYLRLNLEGLFEDEKEALEFYINSTSNLMNKKILLVGAGAGRECLVLKDYFEQVVAWEPVYQMRMMGVQCQGIRWINSLGEIENEKFDLIWITRFLPSFLSKQERENFYSVYRDLLVKDGFFLVKPDVMPLSWRYTFKYKLAEYFLKINPFFKNRESGDTVRKNLDFNTVGKQLVFYHYFPSDEKFLEEIVNLEREVHIVKTKLGFIFIKFIKH